MNLFYYSGQLQTVFIRQLDVHQYEIRANGVNLFKGFLSANSLVKGPGGKLQVQGLS